MCGDADDPSFLRRLLEEGSSVMATQNKMPCGLLIDTTGKWMIDVMV